MPHLAPLATVLALLPLALPSSIPAQQVRPLAAGQRVRAWVGLDRPRTRMGTIAALRGDTLVLDHGRSGTFVIPPDSLARLERSAGPGRCGRPGARLGCVVGGAVVGALVGGVIGYSTTRGPGDLDGIGVIAGVPAGLVVGLLVGAFVASERWEPVPLPVGTATPPR